METKTFLMTSTYYPPYHIGGDAVHVKYLSEELVKLGHEVHVMFSLDAYKYKRPEFKGSLKSIEEINGVYLHPLQSPLGKKDLYLTYLFGKSSFVKKRFDGLIKQTKPDVVHHHNIFFLGYDILKKQGDYTNLYTAHDYWLICQRYDLMKYGQSECKDKNCLSCILLSKRLPQIYRSSGGLREALKDINSIIAPSNYMKKKLSERLPVSTNIVHISHFAPSLDKNIQKSGYTNYILYVGVLERHKGICNLIKAFRDCCKGVDSKLIIVGEGSLKKNIVEYISNNKLKDKVIILGLRSGEMLRSLYNDALALIVPSICPEVFGLVAIEAMSVGTPVIGTRIGGLGEILANLDTNYMIEGDGVEVIKMVFENKTICSKEKIKEVYNRCYSPQTYLKKYFELL